GEARQAGKKVSGTFVLVRKDAFVRAAVRVSAGQWGYQCRGYFGTRRALSPPIAPPLSPGASLRHEALAAKLAGQPVKSGVLGLQFSRLLLGQAGLLASRERFAEIRQQRGDLLVAIRAALSDQLLRLAKGA